MFDLADEFKRSVKQAQQAPQQPAYPDSACRPVACYEYWQKLQISGTYGNLSGFQTYGVPLLETGQTLDADGYPALIGSDRAPDKNYRWRVR